MPWHKYHAPHTNGGPQRRDPGGTMVAEIADVRALVHAPFAEQQARRTQFIAALYQRHRRSLLWYLTRLTPNRADAEEIAQEAFVRLLGAQHLETEPSRSPSASSMRSAAVASSIPRCARSNRARGKRFSCTCTRS
jgi:hypothetical protein